MQIAGMADLGSGPTTLCQHISPHIVSDCIEFQDLRQVFNCKPGIIHQAPGYFFFHIRAIYKDMAL